MENYLNEYIYVQRVTYGFIIVIKACVRFRSSIFIFIFFKKINIYFKNII